MRQLFILGMMICLLQITHSQPGPFVRIYDNNDNKLFKGILVDVSDSSLSIRSGDSVRSIHYSEINTIRLRRSVGHTILVSSLITAAVGGVAVAVSADPDATWFAYDAGEGFLMGFGLGAPTGVLLGAIIGGTRKRPVFKISHQFENWEKSRELLKAFLPEEKE